MQLIRSIIQLLEKGYSYRSIAIELKVNRKSVTTYSKQLKASGLSYIELRGLSDAQLGAIVYVSSKELLPVDNSRRQDFKNRTDYFFSELKRTGVTRLLLWEEYRKAYPQGFGYTQYCILLKDALKIASPSMHLVHKPGEMMMVDFAGDSLSYVDRSTGEVMVCPVLVVVLPFSDYTYVTALPNAMIPLSIKGLNGCMQFLGGVPQCLKTDNMKQVVTKSCRYEPLFTEAFQQWSQHYNITLLATRVAKPKDKAAVENEVRIAYQRIYAPIRDEIFYSIEELNKAIARQLELHNNKHFQRKDFSRSQLFLKEEKSLLQPLPEQPFIMKHQVQPKVQKNYHITLGEDWHHYSVPYGFIGKTVTAVYDTDIVEVYYQLQRIALHKRSYKKHDFTTIQEHMPEGHLKYHEQRGWTPEYFINQAKQLGPDTTLYMQQVLKARQFTEQTYNACRGILRLALEFGVNRLEVACKIAIRGQTFNYRTVSNILKNNQDKAQHQQTELFRIPDHPNLRGPDAYQ